MSTVPTPSLPISQGDVPSGGSITLDEAAAGHATLQPVNLEYYQRELGFWRSETTRLRAQIEHLSNNEHQPPVASSEETTRTPSSSMASTPQVRVNVARRDDLIDVPDNVTRTLLTKLTSPSDSEFERKAFQLAKLIASFVVGLLLAWRVLIELPFWILFPSVVIGFALGYPSNVLGRRK